jgi:DNA-binding PadR family transcriptional regulator
MHGYQLMKRLEKHSGGVYRARAGTVYPILQQLEDESLIVSELREGKKVYVLTEEGKRELAEKREAVQRIWRRSRRWEDWAGAQA